MLHQALARSLHGSKVQFVVEDTWPFRERTSGQNGRLNPLRMDITTQAGALFDNHLRLNNKVLLLDITIVNPCAGSNLRNAARHVKKHLADAVGRKKNKYRDSFPATYSLLPLDMSTCSEVGSRACPHQGAHHQTSRTQVGDTLQQVSTSGGREESSTSSAALLFCFTAGTFVPHALPSLQTGGVACEHPTARFARLGVCTHASFREDNRIRGMGRSERGWGRDRSRGRERRLKRGRGWERGLER